MQKTGKKPNTIVNKAKTFCEINQFTFLKLQLLKWMKGEDEFKNYLTEIRLVRKYTRDNLSCDYKLNGLPDQTQKF